MKKQWLFGGIILLLLGCDPSKLDTKPAHTGSPGEIVVIAENKIWNEGLEEAFAKGFGYAYPMLPQRENAFNIGHYTPAQFSMIIERHRNIVWVEIDPALSEDSGNLKVVKDQWSKAQLFIEITAGSIEKALELLNENKIDLIRIINRKENDRLANRFRVYDSPAMMELVQRKFDFQLVIPEGFKLANDTAGFFWMQRERSKTMGGIAYYIIQNLAIYYLPYDSDSAFTDANLLEWRDKNVKYIPATVENSYMKTVYSFEDMDLYPIGEDVEIANQYGRLIRGLWNMENDFMGGPFIQVATYDDRKKQILVIEGQVFAPKFDKREYIREMEAVLFSLRFPSQTNPSTESEK